MSEELVIDIMKLLPNKEELIKFGDVYSDYHNKVKVLIRDEDVPEYERYLEQCSDYGVDGEALTYAIVLNAVLYLSTVEDEVNE